MCAGCGGIVMETIPLMDGLRVMGIGLIGVFSALALVFVGVSVLKRVVEKMSFGTDTKQE